MSPPGDTLRHHSVLVTGGAGFIGSHLVDSLLANEARVRVLDNLATGRKANIQHALSEIEFLEGDIRDPETCRKALSNIEFVFHQAALGSVPRSLEDPATSISVNVTGTAQVFAAARDAGVKRVVYASSSSVYGDSAELPKIEGQEGKPLSPYAWSKKMNEDLASSFADSYDMEFVGLRYFNVYGPRQDPSGAYAAVIPRFFAALLQGNRPAIYGDGEQSRDFTSVRDAVMANLLAAEAAPQACGKAYNVAGGRRVTVNKLAEAIGKTVGEATPPRYDPPRPGDVRHSLADLKRSEEFLNYQPQDDFETGIERCLDYYRRLLAA